MPSSRCVIGNEGNSSRDETLDALESFFMAIEAVINQAPAPA